MRRLWQLFGRAGESNTVPVWKKRESWGDSSPTTILKAAAPNFLQFGSYVQKKWPRQEPTTPELAHFKRVLALCRFHRSVYFLDLFPGTNLENRQGPKIR